MYTGRRIAVLLLSIGATAAEVKTQRIDLYGEPLPPGALARLGPGLHPRLVLAGTFAFAPDGKTMATVAADGTLRLEKPAAELELLRPFQGPRSTARSLALSADGRESYSAGRGIIAKNGNWLLEAARQRKSPHFSDHKKKHWLLSVAVSPGRYWRAVAFPDGTLRIWAAKHPDILRQLQKYKGPTQAVVFSPDGKQIASAAKDGTVRLWDAAGAKEIRRLQGLPEMAVALAYSHDGKMLAAAGREGAIRIWSTSDGKEIRRLQYALERCPVYGVAFAMEGETVMVGGHEYINQWVVATGKRATLGEFSGTKSTFALAVSPKGDVMVMAIMDGSIFGWGLTGDAAPSVSTSTPLQPIRSVAFSPDGNTVATAGVVGVRLWEPRSGREKRRLIWNQDRELRAMAFAPDGGLLASGAEDGALRVWELPSGCLKQRFKCSNDVICTVAFLDRGIVASGYNDGMVQLWDVMHGRQLRSFGNAKRYVWGFGVCPHKQLLASVNEDDGIVRVWDAKTGQEKSHFQAQRGGVGPVAFSPRGDMLATLSEQDQTARLWDAATGRERKRFSTWGSEPVAFSPDGRILALRGKDGIQLMDIATGRERLLFWEPHNHNPNELAFSPDGTMLASTGGDGTALIWDVTGRCPDGRWQTHDLSADQVKSDWQALGGENAATAHRSVWELVAAPRQTVSFLQKHLRPAALQDTKRLPVLVADLDSDQFAVREAATRELEAMGEAAEPVLRKVLANKPTLELRRRVESIVKKLDDWPASSPNALRAWRAVEVLEHLGTSEARQLLRKLAEGAPDTRLTREAKAALQRLAAHPARMP